MRENWEGFLYPIINSKKCIECGICMRICPVTNTHLDLSLLPNPYVYATKVKDLSLLQTSSSGGVFIILAKHMIENGGVVYGAAFDAALNVKHIRAKTLAEATALQGSKYVESSLGGIFLSVKRDLSLGREVLFSGTPCQVAGLNAYFGKKRYSNLVTIDILCHGVPSHKLWHSYLRYLESLRKSKIIEYSFRDKSKWGWGNWGSYTYVKNASIHKHYFPVAADHYSLYFKDNCFRESCYTCKFASLPRQGDITLGDYWEISKVYPEFNTEQGASVVFINTEIGQRYYELIKPLLCSINSVPEHAISNNKTLVMPTQRPVSRTGFYEHFVLVFMSTSTLQILEPLLKYMSV